VVALAAWSVGFPGPRRALAADAYPDKEIDYIVPTSPGGGFDTISRMFIPYFQKYLPNHPNIIVKNIKGGEWNIGISALNRAAPDGYTVGIFNMPGNAVNQVLGTAPFDLNKFVWLGNLSDVTYVACVSKESKYKTVEAMQKAPEVTAAVVGLSSMAGLGTILAADAMHFKVKPIPHDGSTEAILSAIRGDVDLVQYPLATLKKTIIDSHDLIPVWVYAKTRLAELPDVPTVVELGYPELAEVVTMFRPVAAPPGTPLEIAKVLRDAFGKAASDPEFVQKVKDAGATPNPLSGEEVAQIIGRQVKKVGEYKDLILKYRK
jgi:tripartite-type tricarboxylate transporter receptor subunit TctC